MANEEPPTGGHLLDLEMFLSQSKSGIITDENGKGWLANDNVKLRDNDVKPSDAMEFNTVEEMQIGLGLSENVTDVYWLPA